MTKVLELRSLRNSWQLSLKSYIPEYKTLEMSQQLKMNFRQFLEIKYENVHWNPKNDQVHIHKLRIHKQFTTVQPF